MLALLVGLVGLAAGLALPFAPVYAQRAEVSWPPPGQPTVSSTAILVPYRPAELRVAAPCPVLRAAGARGAPVTVLATGGSTDTGAGLLVRVDGGRLEVLVNTRLVALVTLYEPDCGLTVAADQRGVTVTVAGRPIRLPGEPVPEVAAFRTELNPGEAAGMTAAARTVNPFDTRPTGLKSALVVLQLLAAAMALALLARRSGGLARARAPRPRRAWLLDGAVLAVLAGWAVIGPLSDDDGFVAAIARNALTSGDLGNYYRWWSASESPFTLPQRVAEVLAQVSLQPLWLRLPSTVMGAAAWLVLSRCLAGAVPVLATARARALLGVCFLAAWLPYDLGARPEPYVALGATVVLALLWRGRSPAALGAATLVTAVTMTASPSGVLVLAAVAVFAGNALRMLRAGAGGARAEVAARLALLAGIGAVALTLVFADQTLHGLAAATRWHAEFSPSMPWYEEVQRYRYLLGEYQDGNALKRVPVLLCLALLPVVALLLARRNHPGDIPRDELDHAAGRLAGATAASLALLWLTPSKWTLYFGSLAGVFGGFVAVATVLLARRAATGALPMRLALFGGGLVAVAAGLAFAGTNDWWQPALYDVPWSTGPIRPAGLPLDLPPLWAAGALAAAGVVALVRGREPARRVLRTAPSGLTAVAAGTALAVLLVSFASAPSRRPAASLALANLAEAGSGHGCGLGDQVQALPDVPGGVLVPAEAGAPGAPEAPETDQLDGFVAGGGWRTDRPPPDPPGVRASAQVWGSRVDGDPTHVGSLVSRWYLLPALAADQELALTVSGRTGDGNRLGLEFGVSQPGDEPRSLGERIPADLPHTEPLARPDPSVWRSVWVTREQVPAGADRVRVRAADGAGDPGGWLALTGPRLRAVVGLTDYLRTAGPVLVNWPIAVLFPCVRDLVTVAHGVAGAPRAVLAPAGRYDGLGGQSTDPGVAGVFAALHVLGRLGEVPTRVAGHPDLAWGSLQLADYRGAVRDGYRLGFSRVTVPGWAGDDAQIVTQGE